MPQKLTIEYIKEFVERETNGKCNIIDNIYINDREKLNVKCKCGNVFQRDFAHIRRGQFFCNECKKKLFSEKYRADVEDIISKINATGCEYISGEYINGNSILTIRCRCGNVFKKSYAKFSSGQDRCPDCGKESLRQSKFKYSVDYVKEKLSEKGFSMVDEKEYIDCAKPFRCICKRGHEVNIKFLYFLHGQSGCKKCANIEQGSSKHWNYKNGNSNVEEALRQSIYSWKKDVLEMYENKCAVTKSKENVIVHHLVDFYTLLEDASRELNIPVHEHIGDYEKYEDFVLLKDKLVEKHTKEIGIAITRKVHVEFHKECECEKATPEKFDKFLREKYNTCLQEAQKHDRQHE